MERLLAFPAQGLVQEGAGAQRPPKVFLDEPFKPDGAALSKLTIHWLPCSVEPLVSMFCGGIFRSEYLFKGG